MGFGEAVKSVIFKNYATFSGRASRSEYWWFTLFNIIASIALQVSTIALGAIDPILAGIAGLLVIVFFLGIFVPSLAVIVRRLHDVDKSGWWYLIVLTGIGALVVLYWMIIKGTEGDNRFGPDPLGNVADRFT